MSEISTLDKANNIWSSILRLVNALREGQLYDPRTDSFIQLTAQNRAIMIENIRTKRDNLVTLLNSF